MALGNWAIGSKNIKNKHITFELDSGNYKIYLYKNWIYVKPNGIKYPFEFWEGTIHLDRIRIYAERGPQDGIYAVIKSGYMEEEKIFAWVGCYGFDDEPFNPKEESLEDHWVGVLDSSMKFLDDVIERSKEKYL